MDSFEVEVYVVATRAFIQADVTSLVLTPRTRASNGAGGFTLVDGTPRAAQDFRLIPQNDKVPEISMSDGKTAQPEFVLLGLPDAAMSRYDRFTWEGKTWEVAQVHIKPEYLRKGDVVRVA